MSSDQKNLRQRIFPGDTILEIILNEIKDVFWHADFRAQFLAMGVYAAIMMVAYFVYRAKEPEGVETVAAVIAFSLLGAFFIFSDFLKRKKFLPQRPQFWFDSFCYLSLMVYLITQTGGYQSPIIFPLLFLTAVSAPLYGKTLDTIVFIAFVSSLYIIIEVGYGSSELSEIFKESMEGLAIMIAAISVKITLLVYQKKVIDNERLSGRQLELTKKLDASNIELESKVKVKTKDLRAALKTAEGHEQELSRQKSAIVNILDDIAEEKNQSIIEKEKLSRILHSIGDAVLVVDEKRRIILFNRAAERITGYLTGEVIGQPASEILKMVFERDRSPNNIIEEVFKSGKVQEITNHTLLIDKKGKEISIADSAAPITDRDGKLFGCIVVFRDVTHEREIDRQKSEFISVASHQLRTPLTSIKWFLEMLLDGDAGALNKEQREMVEQVFQSGERMIDLVNKLLNVSRIESGRVAVKPVPTDLNIMIKGVITELLSIAKQREIKLQVSSPKLPEINIDPNLVREVFMNLLSNAIKYSKDKSAVTLTAAVKGKDILFSIADEGIGIPKKEQVKIFHKFFRAENAVVRETEGTGMGLYVAKNVVELSGGQIWFKSEEAKGSTFFFTLPVSGSKMIEGEKSLI